MTNKKQKFLEVFLNHALCTEKGIKEAYDLFPHLPKNAPWCSIFLFFAAKKAGIETLPDKEKATMARSWLSVGKKKESPEIGDIVILKRGSNPILGHVGIFCRFDGDKICVLGGNQSGKVCFTFFKREAVLGFREIF